MSDFEYEYDADNAENNTDNDYDNDDNDADNDYDYDNEISDSDNEISNSKLIKKSIINNSVPVNTFESLIQDDSIDKTDVPNETCITTQKKEDKKLNKLNIKVKKDKQEKEEKEEKEEKPEKVIKLTKKEQSFEYNHETIDFFTKDLDFKKILIKNSPFTNDTQIICLLLKYKIITNYGCSVKKCKVKNVWADCPIQLILHRINDIQNDLSSFNLELICANCYLCMYGLEIFKKKEKEIIYKCNICDFPLVKFNNTRKKKGICLACEKKMSKVFSENVNGEFYSKIQNLYNDNPLLSEESKNSSYYKNPHKYKSSNTYNKQQPHLKDSKKEPPINIDLNMSLPSLDDLINV